MPLFRQLRKILVREQDPHAGRLHISTLMAKMALRNAEICLN
jgi:hypothetical protein